jgi:hypothetical protein
MFEDFGRSGRGRLLGRPYAGELVVDEHTNEALAQRAKVQAKAIAESGKIPTAVEYKTPGQRAGETAKRSGVSLAIAATLATVLIPTILLFIQSGDFSSKALTTLIISLTTGLLMTALNWAQKYRQAQGEDGNV